MRRMARSGANSSAPLVVGSPGPAGVALMPRWASIPAAQRVYRVGMSGKCGGCLQTSNARPLVSPMLVCVANAARMCKATLSTVLIPYRVKVRRSRGIGSQRSSPARPVAPRRRSRFAQTPRDPSIATTAIVPVVRIGGRRPHGDNADERFARSSFQPSWLGTKRTARCRAACRSSIATGRDQRLGDDVSAALFRATSSAWRNISTGCAPEMP